VIAYALPLDDRCHFALPILLPDASLTVGGVTLSATDITLDEDGVTIGTAALALRSGTVALVNDLNISPDLLVSGGSLEFDIFGASVVAQDVRVSAAGLSAANVDITLPELLGGVGVGIGVSNLIIRPDLTVGGMLSAFELRVGDLSGRVEGVTLTPQGISVGRARLNLPIVGGSGGQFEFEGFTYDGVSIRLKRAGATIELPKIRLGRLSMQARARLELRIADNDDTVLYDFEGSGTVTVPNVFEVDASIHIGSRTPQHPSNLYRADLSVRFGRPIPLGSAPIALTGFRGGLNTDAGRDGGVIYTFDVGAGLATHPDGGLIFDGNVSGVLATDGNFGFRGAGTLLSFIGVTAGFCLRFVDDNDAACSRTIVNHPEIVGGTGAYVEANGGTGVQMFGHHARLNIDAFGQLYLARGQALVVATVNGTVSVSFLGLDGQVLGQLGRFRGQGRTVLGIKATLSATIHGYFGDFHITRSIFIDQHGNVYITGANDFVLVGPNGMSVRRLAGVTPAPAGAALAGHGRAGAATMPTAGTTEAPFRVVPGQSQTLFELTWRRGAPTLALVAPDGRVITPVRPGPGAYVVRAAGSHAVALYLPAARPGLWRVRLGNLHGGEGYRFTMLGNRPQPALSVTLPRRGQTVVASSGRSRVTVAGSLRNGDAGATVSLFYTRSRTVVLRGRRTPNYAGTPLAANVPVHGGAWRYGWATHGLPVGRYKPLRHARQRHGASRDRLRRGDGAGDAPGPPANAARSSSNAARSSCDATGARYAAHVPPTASPPDPGGRHRLHPRFAHRRAPSAARSRGHGYSCRACVRAAVPRACRFVTTGGRRAHHDRGVARSQEARAAAYL